MSQPPMTQGTHDFATGIAIGLELARKMAERHVGTDVLCDQLQTEINRLDWLTGGERKIRDGEREWQAWMVEMEVGSWSVAA